MSSPMSSKGRFDVTAERSTYTAVVAVVLVFAVTSFHYATDLHDTAYHDVYRRLNYIPIVLGAFAYGFRGGIGTSLLAAVAYVPHAFIVTHRDPAPVSHKVLEIVLYLAVGALTGWLVDQQRRVSRELRQALNDRDVLQDQLVRAGKLSAIGRLTSGLAHEIRNPLASISGAASALVSEFDEGHEKHEMAQVLTEEIERLNSVVTQFLEFARLEAVPRSDVDLAEVAAEVVALARGHSGEVELTLEGGPSIVLANRDHVKQVILNLLLNALNALAETESPAIHLRVVDRVEDERTYRCVSVSDNGPGVPDELRARIFEPYFTTRNTGTGLGLSISERILEAHDGKLTLDENESGARFSACFPVDP